ncbi:MAG: hypothetical protein AAFV29_03105, partial [Myxococcota bacterium]
PNAALVVIIVSDEDDQSQQTPIQYGADLQRRTPNGVLPAVVSGQLSGCSSASGVAGEAPTYESFLSLFGNGISASICADWGQTLASLGGEAFGLRRSFRLAIPPAADPAPIVRLNGQMLAPTDYAFVDRDLVFVTPPPEGAVITIEYSPDC